MRNCWYSRRLTSLRALCTMVKSKKQKIAKAKASAEKFFHDFSQEEVTEIQSSLLDWYDANKRDLPWRSLAKKRDDNERGYAVWVSEIMLQQTQVATVIDYYNRWMQKWPTMQALAEASLEEVNEMWAGLGYYSRGRRLHEGACKVVRELGGQMPRTAEELVRELPGVGPYTAGAIASIAFGQSTGLVDGNVIRVLSRMRAIGADSSSPSTMEKFWSLAREMVDKERPGDFNQAVMELGATVCTPKTPQCSSCPVSAHCLALKQVEERKKSAAHKLMTALSKEPVVEIVDIECAADKCSFCMGPSDQWDDSLGVQNYPRKAKKKAAREEVNTVYIVRKADGSGGSPSFLIVQRPQTGLLAGLWEFPNQKQDDSSTETEEARKFIKKSFGVTVNKLKDTIDVGEVVHIFSHIHQTYRVLAFHVGEGEGEEEGGRPGVQWVSKEGFMQGAVSTAMKKVFKAYENHLTEKSKASKRKASDMELVNGKKKQLSINSFFSPKQS